MFIALLLVLNRVYITVDLIATMSTSFIDLIIASAVTLIISFLNCVFFFIDLLFYKGKMERNPNTRIVVITGCDSGFGLIASNKLTGLGYQVIALCLSEEGVERLKGSVALALQCDVTKESDVFRMAADVKKYAEDQRQKVYAVINNAGVLALGAVEWCPMSAYERVMAVNFFGAVNVTKAMIPLLKANRGSRFIYISSVAGIHSFALGSSYFASKHALEGFTKSFRQEMKVWGVHVCNINPSFTRTPFTMGLKDMLIDSFSKAPSAVSSQYSDSFIDTFDSYLDPVLEEPQPVIDSICFLLDQKYPEMWTFPSTQSKLLRSTSNVTSPVLDCALSLASSFVPQPKPEVILAVQA